MSATNYHKNILSRANVIRLQDVPVRLFMRKNPITLRENFSIRSTIETFGVHHISGAPVVNYENRVIGVISEYDLLIQASSSDLSAPIKINPKIIAVYPETTLKEVLVLLYKNKLKWVPVVNKENYIKGIITRIDVLYFLAGDEPEERD